MYSNSLGGDWEGKIDCHIFPKRKKLSHFCIQTNINTLLPCAFLLTRKKKFDFGAKEESFFLFFSPAKAAVARESCQGFGKVRKKRERHVK